jgi:exodeoxyribonuclease V alpha subunit
MVPTDLWNNLFRALPANHPKLQIILILDIQQLPPVFGRSIAIHALEAGIKKVELIEVYRQALESPIISLAHRILSGKVIPKPELDSWNIDKLATGDGKLTIKPWKKALSSEAALYVMSKFLPEQIDEGNFDPTQDTILTPYQKAFGTIELNKIVATHLAHNYNPDKEPVFEIIAGFNKKYFRVGDKVLWNKTEHFITKIEKNSSYFGNPFKAASLTLDYDGVEHDKEKISGLGKFLMDEDDDSEGVIKNIDDILGAMAGNLGGEKEDMVRAASHRITVYSEEFDCYETLDTAGDLNALDLGYAMTVHKSQGSEYRRVFFITHASQANMLFRELVYTAVTRAREELVVICPPSLFVSGVTSQRLPGKTLEDKIAAFERYMKISKVSEEEKPLGLYLFKSEE